MSNVKKQDREYLSTLLGMTRRCLQDADIHVVSGKVNSSFSSRRLWIQDGAERKAEAINRAYAHRLGRIAKLRAKIAARMASGLERGVWKMAQKVTTLRTECHNLEVQASNIRF